VKRIAYVLLALSWAGCGTPLAVGERMYREGDRLAALETWRAIPEDDAGHEKAQERITVVEEEFHQLVVRYKQRARYFEAKERLAESIINYRLALKLQPHDAATLAHVQDLAREVVRERQQLRAQYRTDFEAGYLAKAGASVEKLRTLDPFDPALQTVERELDAGLQQSITRLLAVGRRGFSEGNHIAAERAFQSVLAVDPNNESARGYLSYIETIRRASQAAGGEPAAFEPPQAFASDAEIRAEGFHQNSLAAEASGDDFAAIIHDQQALNAFSDHADARQHLAEIRLRITPQVEILIEEGRIHFRDEDLQSALDSWRQALLIDPGNERARAYAARAVTQLENLEALRSEPDVASGDR